MFKYVCKREDHSIWSYLIDSETDRTIEIHRDQAASDGPKIGDIYIAKVESIVKNIGAAFVRISPEQNAYLPLEGSKTPIFTKKGSSSQIQQGDELVVQVRREAIKGKLPAVSMDLSLQGSFVSVETGSGVSVSKKLDEKTRERLRETGRRLLEKYDPDHLSLLFRTKSGEAGEKKVCDEAERLIHCLSELIRTAQYRVCYSRLYTAVQRYMERPLHIPEEEIEKIVVDEKPLFASFAETMKERNPALLDKLILYQDPMLKMELLYSLDHRKREAVSQTVPLKSGGSIVISPTEALTAIDVNSGKNVVTSGRKTKEELVLKTNLEAAAEISRQLRLRNMSGIIIVDFINMQEHISEKTLMERFTEMLRDDPIKTVLVDITKLGLVEITRKKTEKPLWEEL